MYESEFTKEYRAKLMENNREYSEEFSEILSSTEEKRRLYHGKVIPMTYQGCFFDEKDIGIFNESIRRMAKIGRKVTAEFVNNPEYRKGFRFSKEMEDLILISPGYEEPVPVGRYDIFYNGDDEYKFCELNTDGSSAMNEDRVLGEILFETNLMNEMKKDWEIDRFELFHSLVKIFAKRYTRSRGVLPRTVAIVDFVDKGTTIEFEIFKKAFEEEGYLALICDPREMHYENGKLIGTDKNQKVSAPIDMVYRRVVTSDFLERIDECEEFLNAYKDNAFMMFGSFRSQVMHSKVIFDMLLAPETKRLLTDNENKFLEKHIPKTKKLLTEEDFEEVIENKDKYILKPYNSYASDGILLGRDYDKAGWENTIKKLSPDSYIYQEYVDVSPWEFVEPIDGKFVINNFNHVLGMFMYGENFSGCYIRIGKSGIVSGARDYYVPPAFMVKRKNTEDV